VQQKDGFFIKKISCNDQKKEDLNKLPNKIFCIIGKSGTGKDSVFRRVIKNKELNLSPVILHTTRPIRVNETDGFSYYFVNEIPPNVIYKQTFNVIKNGVNDVWEYALVDDGQIDLSKSSYLLITTVEGYEKIREKFSSSNVVALMIEVPEKIRIERLMKREVKQEKKNIKEINRRIKADSLDFSPERTKEIKNRFMNVNLGRVVREIGKVVKKEKGE
jgi:guanylate kinase